jgi:hypothetical protein
MKVCWSVISHWLIVNSTCVAFLNRWIDWINTPNLTIVNILIFSFLLSIILFGLLPIAFYTPVLDLLQNTVRAVPDNIWRLLSSTQNLGLVFSRLPLDIKNLIFFYRLFPIFQALWSFKCTFFILVFFSYKAGDVRLCNIKFDSEGTSLRDHIEFIIRRSVFRFLFTFPIFHAENF